jgi:hypothetical protein
MASKAMDPTTTNDMFVFLIFSCETTIFTVMNVVEKRPPWLGS